MAPEDEVDPDAKTIMPAPERDEGPAASRWSAEVTIDTGEDQIAATMVGITAKEAQVTMPSPPEVDTDVSLDLPTDPPTAAKARVLWTRAGKGPEPATVGLEFTEIDVEGFEAVEALVAEAAEALAER